MMIWLGLYWLVWWLYAAWSYLLTDPNLVLTTWQPYWQAQLWWWRSAALYPWLPAVGYALLVLSAWLVYSRLIKKLPKTNLVFSAQNIGWYLVFLLPLLLSYNALSHDVFNYIFNAKMVVEYGMDPHVHVALEFPQDTWTRFMHNTHTAAPYGYGWTVTSLVPFVLGLGKFLPTWLLFRLAALVSMGMMVYAMLRIQRSIYHQEPSVQAAATFLLHPLILIEVVSTMHNDLWMVAPAVLSLGLLMDHYLSQKKTVSTAITISACLLLYSISIKWATLVLVPVWVLLAASPWWIGFVQKKYHLSPQKVWMFVAGSAAALLFVPLTTARSQQFHPWYWSWMGGWLPWLPPLAGAAVQALAVSSQLRYLPWLWFGYYDDAVLVWQKVITWVGAGVLLGIYCAWYFATRQARRT